MSSKAAMQQADRESLKSLFFQSVDMTRINHYIDRIRRGLSITSQNDRLIGEGTHFRAYLITSHRKDQIDLVLKIPKSGFIRSYGPGGLTRWGTILEMIQSYDIPLVPPIVVVPTEDNAPALVMPFGESPLIVADDHWQPLSKTQLLMEQTLKRHNLVVGDWIQGCCFRKIPFIHDFSDLRQKRD